MPIVPAAELERLTAEIFAARNVPRDDADWIAMLLVRANLRGHDSHGVIRVPQYCAALKSGHLNPIPKIQLAVDTPTIAVLDGDHGFGQVVARRGTALAIERGRTHGLAAVALRRTSHVGRLADYAETIAVEGLVGMLWANAKSGLNVAPWGGSGKRLGTNPHAIEILGGILSGTGAASAEKGKFANGTLIVTLDPARFLPPAEFHAQVAALFAWVRGASPAAGASEILVPGEPEARTERARRAEGVAVEDETWRQITACASEVGVRA